MTVYALKIDFSVCAHILDCACYNAVWLNVGAGHCSAVTFQQTVSVDDVMLSGCRANAWDFFMAVPNSSPLLIGGEIKIWTRVYKSTMYTYV